MVQYSKSPGWVDFSYTALGRAHKMTVNVLPNNPVVGSTGNLLNTKSGGTVTLAAFATAWADIMKLFGDSTLTISSAELWSQPTPEDDPVWVESVSIGIIGTGAGGPNSGIQYTVSFRTLGGHIVKLVQQDTNLVPNTREANPFVSGGFTAMRTYVLGTTSVVVGRDGSYASTGLFATSKLNDTLRKKIIGL